MAPEQTYNNKNGRPNGGLRFCKQAAALLLALVALVGILITGTMYSDFAQCVSSEPVYEATPEQVNPALEGKLVKMRVTELVANGGPLTDEAFGLSKENAIALHRFYLSHRAGRVQVNQREIRSIREAFFLAPKVKAGAYTIKAREGFWEDLGGEYINPSELTLPTAWENCVVSRTEFDITLRTDDTSNLAASQAVFRYMWVPSPWRGVRHMVGRQQGDVLDLTGEGCGLIRGEEQYQQWTRKRPAMGQVLMPIWEYGVYILGGMGCITLCLLPAVLMVQKRGWMRATCFSVFLGMLLSALVASALLLLPYSEHNGLTWTYTLLPCLIAIVLLCFPCRKKG